MEEACLARGKDGTKQVRRGKRDGVVGFVHTCAMRFTFPVGAEDGELELQARALVSLHGA